MRSTRRPCSPGPCSCLSAGGAFLMARAVYGTSDRGFTYMPDMAQSVPYDSFAPNPVTRDGKTLQAPVPGTHSARVPAVAVWRHAGGSPACRTRAAQSGSWQPRSTGAAAGCCTRPSASCVTASRDRATARWYRGSRIRRRIRRNAYAAMAPGQILHVITYGSDACRRMPRRFLSSSAGSIVHYVGACSEAEANGHDRSPSKSRCRAEVADGPAFALIALGLTTAAAGLACGRNEPGRTCC